MLPYYSFGPSAFLISRNSFIMIPTWLMFDSHTGTLPWHIFSTRVHSITNMYLPLVPPVVCNSTCMCRGHLSAALSDVNLAWSMSFQTSRLFLLHPVKETPAWERGGVSVCGVTLPCAVENDRWVWTRHHLGLGEACSILHMHNLSGSLLPTDSCTACSTSTTLSHPFNE